MKLIASLVVLSGLACGCVAGDVVPHADSPAAEKRDQGPALCRDGTVPPCNDRD